MAKNMESLDAKVIATEFYTLFRGCNSHDKLVPSAAPIWFSPQRSIAATYANDAGGAAASIWEARATIKRCLSIDDSHFRHGEDGFLLNITSLDPHGLHGVNGHTSANHEARADFFEFLMAKGIQAVHYARGHYGNEGLVILDISCIEIYEKHHI